MKIRQAVKQDGAEIAQLLRGMGWFSGLAAETAAQTEGRIARLLTDAAAVESHSVYVAVEAGQVVGYTAVHWLPYLFLTGLEGYVSELFVRETVRGQGVGRQLLAAVETEARQRGCTRLSLLNGRHRESYQRQFYEKMGWEERPLMANFVHFLEEAI